MQSLRVTTKREIRRHRDLENVDGTDAKAHGPELKDQTEMQTSVGGQQWTQTGETSQEYVKARSLTAAGFVAFCGDVRVVPVRLEIHPGDPLAPLRRIENIRQERHFEKESTSRLAVIREGIALSS